MKSHYFVTHSEAGIRPLAPVWTFADFADGSPLACLALLSPPLHTATAFSEPLPSAGVAASIKQPAAAARHPCREGYEEGLSTTHKVLSAAAFIAGDSPIEMLGQYTAIAVEGPNSEGELVHAGPLASYPLAIAYAVCFGAVAAARCCMAFAASLHAAQRDEAQNKSNSTGLTGRGAALPRL